MKSKWLVVLFLAAASSLSGCDCGTEDPPTDGGDGITCAPAVTPDNKVFIERYKCSETPTSGGEFCANRDDRSSLRFTRITNSTNRFQVTDLDSPGYYSTGQLCDFTFTWSLSDTQNPGFEYNETGTWTFTDSAHFSGNSSYNYVNTNARGRCRQTGAEDPEDPPEPPAVGVCL